MRLREEDGAAALERSDGDGEDDVEPKLLDCGDKVTKLRGDALDGRAFAGWTGDRLIGRCRLFVRASALATSALLNVGG